jgi:N-glycosylase/DNA lyase
MHTAQFLIPTPASFSFWRTVYSHGWCVLPPFSVDAERQRFERSLRLHDGTLVHCEMSERHRAIVVRATSTKPFTAGRKKETVGQLRECFRLTESFEEFYAHVRKHTRYGWIVRQKAGRLLRAPTVFEDVVKMICTTNCSWSLTETMVENLTRTLGERFEDGHYAFPLPDKLAGVSESFVRKEIRAGYRSPYLIEFAERVASGTLNPEAWRVSALPTEQLLKEIRSVKGVGEYAAGNLMKLLGRYEYLGLDSWVRKKFYTLHTRGRRVSDARIERTYTGAWRGLVFWLEMTKEWYDHKFPF